MVWLETNLISNKLRSQYHVKIVEIYLELDREFLNYPRLDQY